MRKHDIKDKPKDAINGWGLYWLKQKYPFTWIIRQFINKLRS